MKLIDESYNSGKNNKNILTFGIVGIVLLLIIIISLLLFVVMIGRNDLSLKINNKKASECLYEKDNTMYVAIEELSNYLGYTYKTGVKTGEDDNKCYVTNSNIMESTFFEVGSTDIFKMLEDTNETEYYTIDKPVIKENGKIYMPMSGVSEAFNAVVTNNKKQYNITSIEAIEAKYNKVKSKTFMPSDSIVWNTLPSNKKLLKDNLVIVSDSKGLLGISKVNLNTNNKTKITSVVTDSVIDPKYDYIKYVQKNNQLIVEAQGKRGIIQLNNENGNITKSSIVSLQYDNIKPISKELFLVTEKGTEAENEKGKENKYGIVKAVQGSEELILPMEYSKIGVDNYNFTNNKLNNEYIIYDSLIPVKKDNLWGFINLKGKLIIKPEYTGIGYVGSNTNTNVLTIPDVKGIVVQKDKKYGVLSTANSLLIKPILDKITKTSSNGKEEFIMEYNGKEYPVIEYLKNPSKYPIDNK